MKRAHDPTLRRFDALQSRAFDSLAKYAGNTLVYNGKKARVISQPISYELIQEIVGYKPKRFADIEIKRTDFDKLGLANEVYVALDDVVLRVRKDKSDPSDISRHLVLHSTPDQDSAGGSGAASEEESGSIALDIGQVEVFQNFARRKSSHNYVFTELYIEKIGDPNPIDLSITPFDRTIDNFKLAIAAPDTTGYVLYWAIKL